MKAAAKFVLALVLALLLAWAVRTYVFTVFSVPAGGLPPQLKEGNRVIVNRMNCDDFQRGEVVVFADSVVFQRKNQHRKIATEAYYIGRIEKLPGDTIRLDTLRYVIPTICCKRCGCKDCRYYLVKTSTGQQLVHKHQMIGKAYKLF
ncbi:MAG TPA: signal peptidase I [Prevotella sp.]|nr:signal peptidase I [uncultured Prevotella sp.]HBF05453.1 signal peptidase I [Candidatus Segatella violae]